MVKTENIPSPETQLPNFDKLWNYGKPAETEQQFREILQRAELSYDKEYLAQLLTQIARCEGLQGQFEAGHTTLNKVEMLIDEHNLKLARVRYLLERGRIFNSSGKQGEAIPLFLLSYELADAQKEMRYAIDALHMVAIAERDPHKQVEWNQKAILIAQADPAQQGWLNALLNNIGESYLSIHDYESAASSFHRLIELQIQSGRPADIYTIKDKSKALRLGGRPGESLRLIQSVFEQLESEKREDGYIRQELAEALYASGYEAKAKPHFAKAYELLSKDDWVVNNEPGQLARIKQMSI